MKTKKLITTNLIIYAIFFVINYLLLRLENLVKDSTIELLSMNYFLLFLLVLVLANKNEWFNIQHKFKLYFIKGLIVALIFIIFYIIIFCFNWFVYYKLLK